MSENILDEAEIQVTRYCGPGSAAPVQGGSRTRYQITTPGQHAEVSFVHMSLPEAVRVALAILKDAGGEVADYPSVMENDENRALVERIYERFLKPELRGDA